jgi:hypothetical protein
MNSLIVCALVIVSSNLAFGAEPSDRDSKIKMHEQMAEMHQKAAACMKSGKTDEECQTDMKKQCSAMMKSGDCNMMDHMGMMKDKHSMNMMNGGTSKE